VKKSVWRLWLPLSLAIALLALNCGVALLYTIPERLRGRRMSARLAEERKRVKEIERRMRSSRNSAAILDENTKDSEEFYRRVRGDRGRTVVETQQELWQMAEKSGLAPKTLTCVQEELKAVPLTRLRVTMPLSGSYDQLLSFLGRVEEAKRFLIVDGVRLSSKKDRVRALDINISAYFHDEESDDRSRGEHSLRRPQRKRR
jgi:Tfp pilus assembly protein PilO